MPAGSRVIALENSAKESNTITLLQRYASTLSTRAERAMKQLIDLQKLKIPPAPCAPERTTDNRQLTTEPNDPNPTIEQSPEAELTTDHWPLTTAVFAYSSPMPRLTRVYLGVRTGLKAMAA